MKMPVQYHCLAAAVAELAVELIALILLMTVEMAE
jgi:hypothetical protein